MANSKGTLYLIPNTLGSGADKYVTAQLQQVCSSIETFIVEEIKSARRLLRQTGVSRPLEELTFLSLNEHTKSNDVQELIQPLLEGKTVGLISEAGVPCVADPGSSVVELAHEQGIKVVPLVGPSSILLALMASGFNGQQFTFNGYLPRERSERSRKIRQLEQLALSGVTQIFMDAPYRNNQVLEDLLQTCRMDTKLCIASNITCDNERINTKTITEWSIRKPELNKMPVMFVLGTRY
ncbi:MAG: SAM-dependent methyltransferase [Flavobacteriales bacterium]|jgi:16S rRNA (cytidine1402-2'-O)-methyltransferase